MPRHVSQMSGDHLYLMVCSASGQPKADAVRERLRREIMAVDNIEYSETSEKLLEMSAAVQSNQAVIKAPYQAGIYTALFSGWASLPLVFHYGTASVFNDYFVTADPPEVGDADTWLEVGSWSWGWMEPPLGTISFFLLCIQFAREQRINIGGKPFTERIADFQADKLAKLYPMYDENIVREYGASLAMGNDRDEIAREQAQINAFLEK